MGQKGGYKPLSVCRNRKHMSLPHMLWRVQALCVWGKGKQDQEGGCMCGWVCF